MKEKLFNFIDNHKVDLVGLANTIFDNPECSLEEYKAAELLSNFLEKQGFNVERGIAQLETAFKGTWTNNEGPTIALLGEYDALPLLGHACGHHLQGPAAIGAALAIKEILNEYPYTIVVYGTPAEEGIGGKVQMVDSGCFREADVAIGCHAGRDISNIGKGYKALKSYIVTFKGIGAHASGSPHEGRSALDAMILSFNGLEFMREHIRDECRIHYTIKESTGPSNIVHEKAVALYTLRAEDDEYLMEMESRFKRILRGAALMTDTSYDIKANANYRSGIVVDSLRQIGYRNLRLVDEDAQLDRLSSGGSSDFGNVSSIVPGLMIYTKYCSEPAHSQAWVQAGKTNLAYDSMLKSAKTMAAVAYDLITDNSLLIGIKQEFQTKAK